MSSHSPRRADSAPRVDAAARREQWRARAHADAPRRAKIRKASNKNSILLYKKKLANTLAPTPGEQEKIDDMFRELYIRRLTGRHHSRGGGAGSKRGTQKTKRVYRSKNTRHVPKL
jgi:hypothetical protein